MFFILVLFFYNMPSFVLTDKIIYETFLKTRIRRPFLNYEVVFWFLRQRIVVAADVASVAKQATGILPPIVVMFWGL